MNNVRGTGITLDAWISICVVFLIGTSILVLHSIAPGLFPLYFVYIIVGVILFFVFSQIEFEVLTYFYKHFYVISIILLVLPLIIGQVTRGVVRWIPIGPISVLPAELVRPFLFVFFAKLLWRQKVTLKLFLISGILFLIPFILILVQPSLGVGIVTLIGYIGILFGSSFSKKLLFLFAGICLILLPLFWNFLAPYQKARIVSFDNYNSIQATISVGSGKIFGQGLGKGTETQLAFLPEKQTDFVFAAISEEMGFLGGGIVLLVLCLLCYRIIQILKMAQKGPVRTFIGGIFFSFLFQIFIHVGMNMGVLPITGLTLPLVSAGGSSLIATMITLGMVIGAKK